MASAAEPQTDRELLLKLNGEIERLAESIRFFSKTLQEIEDKKIASIDKRVAEMEKIWSQVSGGWKFAVVIWAILTGTGIVGLVKVLFGK